MQKLLLHTCCAPCVTVPIERLQKEFHITCYFFNPNIQPIEEYNLRFNELMNLLSGMNIEFITGEYNQVGWFESVKGFENEPEGGRRCERCFRYRMKQTALFAKHYGFDKFSTVMSISPHKNSILLNKIGAELQAEIGIEYLEANFKKKDGFKRSIDLSKKLKLYRQNYCGCIFSQRH